MLSMLVKLECGGRNGKPLLAGRHGRDSLAISNRIGKVLIEPVIHLGLVIPHIQLGRRAGHEKIDHPFCLGCKMRQLLKTTHAIHGAVTISCEQLRVDQRGKRRGSDTAGSPPKEVPSSLNQRRFSKWMLCIHDGIAQSRFKLLL